MLNYLCPNGYELHAATRPELDAKAALHDELFHGKKETCPGQRQDAAPILAAYRAAGNAAGVTAR